MRASLMVNLQSACRSSALMASVQAAPAIYDRPVGLRQLHVDPDTGAEHYLVHSPQGLRRLSTTTAWPTPTSSWTGRSAPTDLGPGSYCHFPAMTVMHHEPAPAATAGSSRSSTGPSTSTPTKSRIGAGAGRIANVVGTPQGLDAGEHPMIPLTLCAFAGDVVLTVLLASGTL